MAEHVIATGHTLDAGWTNYQAKKRISSFLWYFVYKGVKSHVLTPSATQMHVQYHLYSIFTEKADQKIILAAPNALKGSFTKRVNTWLYIYKHLLSVLNAPSIVMPFSTWVLCNLFCIHSITIYTVQVNILNRRPEDADLIISKWSQSSKQCY